MRGVYNLYHSKYINHLFLINMFRFRYKYNSITQPHNRSLIFISTELNSNKYGIKVISEF